MKQAYLIMAHNNPHQLERLLHQLDWPENDIYLHLDRKSDCFNIAELKECVYNAKIFIYRKYKIKWGGVSQTKCQIFLLEKASQGKYDFYHLISGQDFPIKNHQDIQSFFEEHQGINFVHFQSNRYAEKENCANYYLLDSMMYNLSNRKVRGVLQRIENRLICLQNLFNIHPRVYCGANWYSITHSLAEDFLRQKKRAFRKVYFVRCPDEAILQTYLMLYAKKEYLLYCKRENDYEGIVREIDWERGTGKSPYVWREKDFDYLISSNRLFARKFDEKIDSIILDKLEEHNK